MISILIIEDEADLRQNLREMLEFENYTVREAPDGEQGLALALEAPPDLIICDISMPRMDGFDVLRQVRHDPMLSHIPFILLTARAEQDAVQQGLGLGANDYIKKPFLIQDVLRAIRDSLG